MARVQLSDALDTYDSMIDSMGPDVITIDEPIGVDGSPAEGAIAVVLVATVVTSIGGAIGAITDTVHGATAGGEPIADDGVTINRKRPFYGHDINPDIAFKSASIDRTMEKKSPSPKRKGGKAGKTKAASTPMPAGPLPMVKPKDYEDFLQGYRNRHPSFGYRQLIKALEKNMHVTCKEQPMKTWLSLIHI